MQPPLTNGTILQNRFRIVKILGQGGCGRTYLATDEQRFQEHCVIKEYFPLQENTAALQKSRELFQREAKILYQIQHPQIPQFRALFEDVERFFFAQDFVEGTPYNILWQKRLAQGQIFREHEVLELLHRLLPVLTYIHNQNIIHRDISLDNIILRDQDQLPVLIDFGVVKLAVEQTEQAKFPYGTVVGKTGYAPIEQLKTGKVYPNSDLYALAVNAIVLLTGQAPADLFDEMTVNWIWRIHAPKTSPKLATILDRMLSYRPQQRYQSAMEVLTALQMMQSQPSLAITVARRPSTAAGSGNRPRSPQMISQSSREVQQSPRSHPRTIAQPTKPPGWIWSLGLIATLGISGWVLTNTFKPAVSKQNLTVSQPLPAIDSSPPNPASPLPSTTQVLTIGKITTPVRVSGQLQANQVNRYVIDGSPDRELIIKVLSGAVRVHILHPDGQTPPGSPSITTAGNYFFPIAGKFLLDVKPIDATQAVTHFAVAIALPPKSIDRPILMPPLKCPPHRRIGVRNCDQP